MKECASDVASNRRMDRWMKVMGLELREGKIADRFVLEQIADTFVLEQI